MFYIVDAYTSAKLTQSFPSFLSFFRKKQWRRWLYRLDCNHGQIRRTLSIGLPIRWRTYLYLRGKPVMFCDNHHRGGIVFLHFGRMLLFYDCYCMWLVRQTNVKLDPAREIVVGHLCYSAAKVWHCTFCRSRAWARTHTSYLMKEESQSTPTAWNHSDTRSDTETWRTERRYSWKSLPNRRQGSQNVRMWGELWTPRSRHMCRSVLSRWLISSDLSKANC